MLPLFRISFNTVPSTYSYGAVVNSAGITDFIDDILAYEDDNFWAHRVSEKGTKCYENNLMSICLVIIQNWIE